MIVPLRKQRPDGSPYRRPPEIETAIATLSRLRGAEIVERSQIHDWNHEDYVPTECLLYFVRHSTFAQDERAEYDLFAAFLDRVEMLSVPELTRQLARSENAPQNMVLLEMREGMLDKFREMLCRDQTEYDERLDYYECRFNHALSNLRLTARKKIAKKQAREIPWNDEAESNEPSTEVEEAWAKLRGSLDGQCSDFHYRFELQAAINSLPDEEKQVIELLLQGVPIDSQEDDRTIVKIVGCAEKTVRNRRDRAVERLRNVLKEEDA